MPKHDEEKMIADAIAGTEAEIFRDATGQDDPETDVGDEADRSLEDMGDGLEGQHEATAGDDDAGDEGDDDEDGEGVDRDPKTGQFKAKDKNAGDDDAGEGDDDDADAGKSKKGEGEEPTGRVPPGRLREERQRRQDAEAARDAALERVTKVETEFQGLSKRLDDLLTAVASGKIGQNQQPPAQNQQPAVDDDPPPDVFQDPEGYGDWCRRQVAKGIEAVETRRDADRVELSMQLAHEKHADKFLDAYKALTSLDKNDPANVQTVRRIWASPNPGAAVMKWHGQVKTLAEVGTDPAAYRDRVAKEARDALAKDPEFRKQLLNELRSEAAGNGNGNGGGRHVTRTARSLNAARGGGNGQLADRRPIDGSERAVFESAFDDEDA